ncbi:hypothetical protein ACF0H5_022185 [Mactra antiquata]
MHSLDLEEVLSTTTAFFSECVAVVSGCSEVAEKSLESSPVGETFPPVDSGWSTFPAADDSVVCDQPFGMLLSMDASEDSFTSSFGSLDGSFADIHELPFGSVDSGPLVSTPCLLLCEAFPFPGDDDVFLDLEETAAFTPCMSFVEDSTEVIMRDSSCMDISETNDSYMWENELSICVCSSDQMNLSVSQLSGGESLVWDSFEVSMSVGLMDSSDDLASDPDLENYALHSPTAILSPCQVEPRQLSSFSFDSPVRKVLAAGFNGYHYKLQYNGYFLHLPLDIT